MEIEWNWAAIAAIAAMAGVVGIVISVIFLVYKNATKRYSATPGYRACWAEIAHCYPNSFRQAMKDVIVPQEVETPTG